MQHSAERIVITHAGSLPRPAELGTMFAHLSHHEPIDRGALDRLVETATREVIRRQLECGIDIGNNGEQPRESFFTYVQHRMTGFGGRSERPPFKDRMAFPSYAQGFLGGYAARPRVNLLHPPKAIGAVAYADTGPLERESALFRRVLSEQPRPFAETFMTAPSPGIIATAMTNEHYPSLE